MKYPFLDLAAANEPYMEELQEAACNVIKSGRYLRGEQTSLLEQEIAGLCEAKYCCFLFLSIFPYFVFVYMTTGFLVIKF